jgi:hypothetical protein
MLIGAASNSDTHSAAMMMSAAAAPIPRMWLARVVVDTL